MKFLVVTPSFNTAAYLDATILSVVTQEGAFELDYHIQDGGSSDGTLEKLEAWSRLLASGTFPIRCAGINFSFAVEKDRGMYDAIATGFDRLLPPEGEPAWMTYINASDQLMPNALSTVMACGREFPEFPWIGSRGLLVDHDGCHMMVSWLAGHPRRAISDGLQLGKFLGFIHQDGTCWTADLWRKAGATMRRDLRAAGDFELWTRFAQHAELLMVDGNLGAFRFHEGQLSGDLAYYYGETELVLGPEGLKRQEAGWAEWKAALNAGDISAMVEGGFTGPVVVYDWGARKHRLSRRLPIPYARIPAVEPLLPPS